MHEKPSKFVGIRFKKVSKIYYFNTSGIQLKRGDFVIAETSNGIEFGKIEIGPQFQDDITEIEPTKIIKKAAYKEKAQQEINKKREKEALLICENKIKEHNLNMKLIGTDLTFDNSKIIFSFTSETRVDFRELVKELASIFRMRIELKQIGVRDEAKAIKSIGMCGRSLCCSTFLGDFSPVSIKMAKDQGLSLNPTKISGACGRLMCCLKYEEETYEDLSENLPRIEDIVSTPDGEGVVYGVDILRQLIKVGITSNEDMLVFGFYDISEIAIVKKLKAKEEELIILDEELIKITD